MLRLLLLAPAGLLLAGALLTALIARRIEARHPPNGSFVEVAGGRLHYFESGPPGGAAAGTIVLVHGASSNHADPMLALGDKLGERYRIIAFDRPGQGWSERIGGPEAALPARQAALLAEGLRRLGVRGAVVVGHSWAGSVVPNFALDHPDVTGALVLISAVTHPWPGGGFAWYYRPASSLAGWLFTRTLTTPVGSLFLRSGVAAVFAPQAPPPRYEEATKAALVLRPAAFQANAQDVAGLHAAVTAQAPRYGEIRVPAVAIGGDADEIVRTDLHSRSFAREVPGAKLIVLPGVGHMPHYSHADLVRAEIESLAAQVAAGREAQAP